MPQLYAVFAVIKAPLAKLAAEFAWPKAPLAKDAAEFAVSYAVLACVLTHVSVELLACA